MAHPKLCAAKIDPPPRKVAPSAGGWGGKVASAPDHQPLRAYTTVFLLSLGQGRTDIGQPPVKVD